MLPLSVFGAPSSRDQYKQGWLTFCVTGIFVVACYVKKKWNEIETGGCTYLLIYQVSLGAASSSLSGLKRERENRITRRNLNLS